MKKSRKLFVGATSQLLVSGYILVHERLDEMLVIASKKSPTDFLKIDYLRLNSSGLSRKIMYNIVVGRLEDPPATLRL